MRRDLKKGVLVKVRPEVRSRSAIVALRGQEATVLSWSQAENCYRVEFEGGGQRIIHRSEPEPLA